MLKLQTLDWQDYFLKTKAIYLQTLELEHCKYHKFVTYPNPLMSFCEYVFFFLLWRINLMFSFWKNLGLCILQIIVFYYFSCCCSGYMSPEYASYGELSTKVDVYSFGVLMLEIISGRKSIVNFTSTSPEQINLVKWVSTFKYLVFYPSLQSSILMKFSWIIVMYLILSPKKDVLDSR